MWQIDQEQWKVWRTRARDVAYGVLFVVALGFFVLGGIGANFGLIGAGMGLLAVIGIGKA